MKVPLKVLIVEDNNKFSKLLGIYLKEMTLWNVEVLICDSANEALAKSSLFKPDVSVVDYMLGDNTGIELILNLRKAGCRSSFIMLTGVEREQIAIKALRARVNDFLLKGELTPATLESSLLHVLERKKMDEAILQEREWLICILESMADGVYIVNQKHDIEYLNPVLIKEFGALKGRKCFEYFHDRQEPCPWCKNKDVFGGKTVRWECYSSVNHKTYELIDSPLKKPDGTISKLEILRDITERKLNEEELLKNKHQTDCLNIELEHKSRELEQVTYAISHDLRTPLVNIQGFSMEIRETVKEINSILKNEDISPSGKIKLTPLLEEGLTKSLDYVLTSASKMDKLLSGLLKVSRLGEMATSIMPLDMNKLIANIGKTFEYKIKHTGSSLLIDELPPCMGDSTQINQVFSNLLENALKYLPRKRPGIIKISGLREEGVVIYCIEDNGIGISADNHKKIFNIFKRIDTKTTTGDGLGLAIIKKIMNRHGKVWVESELGKGSKFFVSLPVVSKLEC